MTQGEKGYREITFLTDTAIARRLGRFPGDITAQGQAVRQMVAHIVGSPWWGRTVGATSVEVVTFPLLTNMAEAKTLRTESGQWVGTIYINHTCYYPNIVLHELAHIATDILTYPRLGGFDYPVHGKEFRTMYLRLLHRYISPKIARLWAETYKSYKGENHG